MGNKPLPVPYTDLGGLEMNTPTVETASNEETSWLKRAGLVGFWFFLVKGLLWIAAPLAIYYLT